MKAQESKGTSRLLVAIAVMAAVAALALALWGCAPQATTTIAATGGDGETTEETAASSMYPDFTAAWATPATSTTPSAPRTC